MNIRVSFLITVFAFFMVSTFSGLFAAGEKVANPANSVLKIEIFDLITGKMVYIGEKEEKEEGGKVIIKFTYKKPDGSIIQTVESTHEKATLKLISYRLNDLRSGQREEVDVSGNVIKMLYQKNSEREVETDEEEWSSKTAFTNVVVDIARRNWDNLNGGGETIMDLLVPSRLETIAFRLKKDSESTLDGEKVVVIRMEPDSWLIRKLVDPLYFYIGKNAPHRLLEYKGRSSIKTDKGKQQDLRTVYHPASK